MLLVVLQQALFLLYVYFWCLQLSVLQVVIVGENGENAATDEGQNREGDEETAKMNEYVLRCWSVTFILHNIDLNHLFICYKITCCWTHVLFSPVVIDIMWIVHLFFFWLYQSFNYDSTHYNYDLFESDSTE